MLRGRLETVALDIGKASNIDQYPKSRVKDGCLWKVASAAYRAVPEDMHALVDRVENNVVEEIQSSRY